MTTTPKLPFVHKKYIHTKKLDAVEIKPLFRGFMGGSPFTTKKGYRGLAIDTQWAQNLFEAFKTDDIELADIAMKSSIADINDLVIGGDFGSPYSIGDFGFYAETQFSNHAAYLQEIERINSQNKYFLAESEWQRVDQYLTKVAHYSQATFLNVSVQDGFGHLALRKNAFRVGSLLLRLGIDILHINAQGEDIYDILKQQYYFLSIELKRLTSSQNEAFQRTIVKTEIKQFKEDQQTLLDHFEGMVEFIQTFDEKILLRIENIDIDIIYRRRCELLNEPFPDAKAYNISLREKAVGYIEGTKEILVYVKDKIKSCNQIIHEFDYKTQEINSMNKILEFRSKKSRSKASLLSASPSERSIPLLDNASETSQSLESDLQSLATPSKNYSNQIHQLHSTKPSRASSASSFASVFQSPTTEKIPPLSSQKSSSKAFLETNPDITKLSSKPTTPLLSSKPNTPANVLGKLVETHDTIVYYK